MNTGLKAVIFDMDGVVSDTQKIHSRIESALLEEIGVFVSAEEITKKCSGLDTLDMLTLLCNEAGKPVPDPRIFGDRKVELFWQCASEYEAIPGTPETIHRVRSFGLRTAIASASRPASIELVLGTLRLRHYFDAIASGKEVPRGKPHPDVFLLAARRIAVEPSQCLVIEDGLSGMLGARAAGMRCIALARDGASDLPADLVVRDLRDVPDSWFF